MNISLFKSTSDYNVVDKVLTDAINKECTARESISIDNPVIILKTDNINISAYTNAYIQEFGRYYYITGREILRNGLVALALETDVLMSFKNEIRALKGTVTRNTERSNAYLIDDRYKALSYKQVTTKKYPQGVDGDTMILITV